jgi:adenylate cyclase
MIPKLNRTAASTAMKFSIATLNQNHHQQHIFESKEVKIGSAADCDVMISSDEGVASLHCAINMKGVEEVEITNFERSIVLNNGPRIHRGTTVVTTLPALFSIGDTQLQISSLESPFDLDYALCQLSEKSRPLQQPSTLKRIDQVAPSLGTLTAWLETLGDLQKSAAGSKAFFKDAARTTYNPGGMDGCMILQPGGQGQWDIVASHIPYPHCNLTFRPDLVQAAVNQQQTIFHDASQIDASQIVSDKPFTDTHTAVVCPVMDEQEKVIAVVYGFRTRHSTNNRIGARALEVQFVQLVAGSIGAALMRMEKEAEASRSRVLLEQAFSPKVARQLEIDPQILQGVTREVTVLFADLRDFTAISEAAGPKVTYQMLTDVMDRFSAIISENDGVVIDFYGDGVSAFWNAPIEQADHTLLAVKTAQEILAALPDLNSVWGQRLSHRLRAGIGIHCGPAQVGNAGSSTRLKYGPQGTTVNIASRLESATKGLGLPMLVSQAVADKVAERFYGRRICQTNLSGLSTPLNLFELIRKPMSKSTMDLLSKYDESLALYESEQYGEAVSMLCDLNLDMPDPAAEYLLKQAMQKSKNNIDRRLGANPKTEIAALTSPLRTEVKTTAWSATATEDTIHVRPQ